jgi:hypothetical protein
MSIRAARFLVPCLAVFHTPDGYEIKIDTKVTAIRLIHGPVAEHVAKGTHSVIYIGGEKFGVAETPEEVLEIIKDCTE